MTILFWSLWITAGLACGYIALAALCRAARDVVHEAAVQHCAEVAVHVPAIDVEAHVSNLRLQRELGIPSLHVPAQRDRRAEPPPWLFEDNPCADVWPDGGAVVVGDWDALGGGEA